MVAGGVMNLLPWGGPTARAASALAVDVNAVFVPLIPALLGGVVWTLVLAWRLGVAERSRLRALAGDLAGDGSAELLLATGAMDTVEAPLLLPRPDRLGVNAALTAALLVALVVGMLPLPVLFMMAFAIALLVNYPGIPAQKQLLARHAGNALAVSGLIFAAGIFTGILSGTKMVDAIANSVIRLVPEPLGPYLAVVTGVLSVPFTFFISNDAFYFGVLPILAKAGAVYGITPVEMARASLVGQPVHLLSPLVPSTFLLVGLLGVEFDEHQKFTLRWSLVATAVLLLMTLVTFVVPLRGVL
jgi:CitMHS family citrate-Mg2+:H+ or citrate-Ca2+:H+ symporter